MSLGAVSDVAYSLLLTKAETDDRHNAALGGKDEHGDPVESNVDRLHQFLGMTDDEGEDADVYVLAEYSNQSLAEKLLAAPPGPS